MTLHKRQGAILILVLFVLTIMGLIASGMAYRCMLETRLYRDYSIKTQLNNYADSALAIAIARLEGETNDFDHLAEVWSTHEPLRSEEWIAAWIDAGDKAQPVFEVDYEVIDEESMIPISLASSKTLEQFGMPQEMIDALADWSDEDDAARPAGAEKSFYLSRNPSYTAKNAPIELNEELSLLRGYKPQDYWGKNGVMKRMSSRAGTTNGRTDDAGSDDSNGGLGYVELLSGRTTPKININTAPLAVLKSLPLSSSAPESIVAFRERADVNSAKLEDHVFRSNSDIEQLQGLSESDRNVLMAVATFQSTRFRIFVHALHRPTGLESRLQVLVQVADGKAKILHWNDRPIAPPEAGEQK